MSDTQSSIALANGVVVKPGDRVPMTNGSLWYVVKIYERTVIAGPPGNSDMWQFDTNGRFMTKLRDDKGILPHIDLSKLAEQRAALASPPAARQRSGGAGLQQLKDRIDTALNNHLVDMKEGWDDSVVGFNDAWDIVRRVLAEAISADNQGGA